MVVDCICLHGQVGKGRCHILQGWINSETIWVGFTMELGVDIQLVSSDLDVFSVYTFRNKAMMLFKKKRFSSSLLLGKVTFNHNTRIVDGFQTRGVVQNRVNNLDTVKFNQEWTWVLVMHIVFTKPNTITHRN